MVANRLQHVAEAAGLWCPDQAGFRAQRAAVDQVLRVSQGVDDGFQRSKPADRTVLALLDFSKAYDRVWRADLLDCMLKKGVPIRLVRWIKGFLEGRRARVRLNGTFSRWRPFKEGLPQGSVLAPLLFLFVIDSLRSFKYTYWKICLFLIWKSGSVYSHFSSESSMSLELKKPSLRSTTAIYKKLSKLDVRAQKWSSPYTISCLFRTQVFFNNDPSSSSSLLTSVDITTMVKKAPTLLSLIKVL